jgi:hypothetical protein
VDREVGIKADCLLPMLNRWKRELQQRISASMTGFKAGSGKLQEGSNPSCAAALLSPFRNKPAGTLFLGSGRAKLPHFRPQ